MMLQIIEIFQPLYPFSGLLVFMFFAIRADFRKSFRQKSKFLTFMTYLSLVIYFVSFFSNYNRIEIFWIYWFLRDLFIFFFLISLWRLVSKHIRIAFGILIIFGIYYQYSRTGKLLNIDFNLYEVSSFDNSEILFQINNVDSLESLKSILEEYDPTIAKSFKEVDEDEDSSKTDLNNYYTLDVEGNYLRDMPKIVQKLNKSGIVEWVEKDDVFALDSIEYHGVDTTIRYEFLTGLNDKFIDKNWGYKYWNEKELFRFLSANKGLKKAKVFILDTGVEANHEDIKANYVSLNKKEQLSSL